MKQSQYNSYDDLPLFLNADIVAKVLGVSRTFTTNCNSLRITESV